ncbi:unnamed protein product [Leuciscus chuanchicus]
MSSGHCAPVSVLLLTPQGFSWYELGSLRSGAGSAADTAGLQLVRARVTALRCRFCSWHRRASAGTSSVHCAPVPVLLLTPQGFSWYELGSLRSGAGSAPDTAGLQLVLLLTPQGFSWYELGSLRSGAGSAPDTAGLQLVRARVTALRASAGTSSGHCAPVPVLLLTPQGFSWYVLGSLRSGVGSAPDTAGLQLVRARVTALRASAGTSSGHCAPVSVLLLTPQGFSWYELGSLRSGAGSAPDTAGLQFGMSSGHCAPVPVLLLTPQGFSWYELGSLRSGAGSAPDTAGLQFGMSSGHCAPVPVLLLTPQGFSWYELGLLRAGAGSAPDTAGLQLQLLFFGY